MVPTRSVSETVFGSQISRSRMRMHSTEGPYDSLMKERVRRFAILIFFTMVFGLLTARFVFVAVVEGPRYRRLSENNRLREVRIPAPRGILYDRNGKPLTRNIPAFVSDDGTVRFEIPASPSAYVREIVAREYPYRDVLAHVIGYTGEVNADELELYSQTSAQDLVAGDIVGKTAIEKEYDHTLRGASGREVIEVDATGAFIRSLGKQEPEDGKPLTLAIDLSLSQAAADALSGRKGAVVVTNPKTGEVMALVSSPSFDPNDFVKNLDVDKILTSAGQPLFNRAISGSYPPGSTFKIVAATAALEEGTITPSTRFEDVGVLKVGTFSFGNWYFLQYGRKDASVDVVKGITRSNDIFFYKLGEVTGVDRIAKWGTIMGMGDTTGIDLPGEVPGVIPDRKWKRDVKGEDWYLGDTYHMAIGQGNILSTPLQVNRWTSVIASDGKLCAPQVIKSFPRCKDLPISNQTLQLIKSGMQGACETGGTGWPLFNFQIRNSRFPVDDKNFFAGDVASGSAKPQTRIPIACKTGTAEYGDPNNHTHAWFTSYAPVNDPQIAVTVLVEGAGEGSTVGAPIAKKIYETYFGQDGI